MEKETQENMFKAFRSAGIPDEPVLSLPNGVRYDFNYGFRCLMPPAEVPKKYRIEVADFDTHIKYADIVVQSGEWYFSKRKYHVNYGIRITELEPGTHYDITFNCKDKPVVIDIPFNTIGDNIAWFTCLDKFRAKNGCILYVRMSDTVRPLFEPEYPEIRFIAGEEIKTIRPYACYRIALYSDSEGCFAPVDMRMVGLAPYAAMILGLNPEDANVPPRIAMEPHGTKIEEPYVCISTHGSGFSKNWLNPDGWRRVVGYLKNAGYRVLDIDREACYGSGILWHEIPREAEDFTGNIPLTRRASLIAGADFFIGLGSGLSWLAWCCKVPVVLISGFSMPSAEFHTPYRVINYRVCHGCFSDPRHEFVNNEFDWCPRHRGTDRHYECSIGITADMVIETIEKCRHDMLARSESKQTEQ